VVAGLSDEFDRAMDSHAAQKFLADKGIEYVNRAPESQKGYGEAITIDLTSEVGAEELRQVSVRGTVAEGVLMVSRINEFNKLYFEPAGNAVIFLYDDRPGVIGTIGVKLAAAGINIEDIRNPHVAKTNRSLAIMKVDQGVPSPVMEAISREIKALSAFSIQF
jgi:D-3-phosphoglycerate dehydrogenase